METDRIKLVPMKKEDYDDYVNHVIATNEVELHYGHEPTDEFLCNIREPMPGIIYFSIVLKSSDTPVGYVEIAPNYYNNLAFYVFKEYRRQGYATEAVLALSRAYFNGTITGKKEQEILAETKTNNEAAIGLLEKTGFAKQGVGMRILLSDDGDSTSYSDLGIVEYNLLNEKK